MINLEDIKKRNLQKGDARQGDRDIKKSGKRRDARKVSYLLTTAKEAVSVQFPQLLELHLCSIHRISIFSRSLSPEYKSISLYLRLRNPVLYPIRFSTLLTFVNYPDVLTLG